MWHRRRFIAGGVAAGRGDFPQWRGARRQRLAGVVGRARAAGVRARRQPARRRHLRHGRRRARRLPRSALQEGYRA